MRILIAAVAIFSAFSAMASDADCLFEVSGKSLVDGTCDFKPNKSGFYLGRKDRRYFVFVERSTQGTATAHWNEGESYAHTDLGLLTRAGPCWQNNQARVCAWKIGEPRFFASSTDGKGTVVPRIGTIDEALPYRARSPSTQRERTVDEPPPVSKPATDAAARASVAFAPVTSCILKNLDTAMSIAKGLNPSDLEGGVVGTARVGLLTAVCEKESADAVKQCQASFGLSSLECNVILLKISSSIVR